MFTSPTKENLLRWKDKTLHHLRAYLQKRFDKTTTPLATPCLNIDWIFYVQATYKKNEARMYELQRVVNIKAGGTGGDPACRRDLEERASSGARFCPSTV